MRRGEALALRWEDVDLEAGVLRVRGTLSRVDGELVRTNPKTAKSTREIPVTPGVVALIRSHRDAQAAERTWAESTWEESGYVFTTEFGRPIDPRSLFRAFVAAVKRSGVDPEGAGLHTLRHSAAAFPACAATLRSGRPVTVLCPGLKARDSAGQLVTLSPGQVRTVLGHF